MKTNFWRLSQKLFLAVCLTISFSSGGVARAQTSDSSEEAKEAKPPASKEVLRPLGDFYLRQRVEELERDLRQQDGKIDSLEDRVRELDRRINDLRNRHD